MEFATGFSAREIITVHGDMKRAMNEFVDMKTGRDAFPKRPENEWPMKERDAQRNDYTFSRTFRKKVPAMPIRRTFRKKVPAR